MNALESLRVIQREYCAGRLGAQDKDNRGIYFGTDGRKCAIGAVIPLELAQEFIEKEATRIYDISTPVIRQLQDHTGLSFDNLVELQAHHDKSNSDDMRRGHIGTKFYKKLLEMISEAEANQFVKTVTWTSQQSLPVAASTSVSLEVNLEESIRDTKTSLIPV